MILSEIPKILSNTVEKTSTDLLQKTINNINTDSRSIQSDDLFIALKGDKFDGHRFVKMQFQKEQLR